MPESLEKALHPRHGVAEASALVERLEDDPDAEPMKAALKRAKIQTQMLPVGERLDLCFQYTN